MLKKHNNKTVWIILLSIVCCLIMAIVCFWLFFLTPALTGRLSKNPAAARAYLSSTGFQIEMPKFKVKQHILQHKGGDDIEERWDIHFVVPLEDNLIYELDSLCLADKSRWKKTTTASLDEGDHTPCYIFSCADSEIVEIIHTITIMPSKNEAILVRFKI